VRNDSLGIPIVSSIAIHVGVLLIASFILHGNHLRRQTFLPIHLVDLPRVEQPLPPKSEALAEIKKPPPPKVVEKPKESPAAAKARVTKDEPLAPPPTTAVKEEPAKVETKLPAPAKTETPSSLTSGPRVEGGSEAGAGNLFGKGDIGVVPGAGTSAGGGGTAASGLGRGAGPPGLPGQPVLRTNREAKAIQSVRATYPPMALRMGMESDVTLRIEVDPEGKVTKAEITKSGGAGFDEEALKAVKQSRFEPAQRDGQNVPAEFTYIYRFRLQR
jgi:protein TonB